MRRRLRWGIVAVAFLGMVTRPGVAAAGDNWVVFTFTAGPLGVQAGGYELGLTYTPTGEGPLVTGEGYAEPYPGFTLLTVYDQADGFAVRTSSDLGGVDVEILGSHTDTREWGLSAELPPLAPGEVVARVFFVANAAFASAPVATLNVTSGSASVAISTGGGSTAVPVVDPATEGPALGAGDLALGIASASIDAEAGLLGAIESSCFCTWSWAAPDGRSASADVTGRQANPSAFAGPPGTWSWSWQGFMNQPSFWFNPPDDLELGATAAWLAWAPIGDDWELFRAVY